MARKLVGDSKPLLELNPNSSLGGANAERQINKPGINMDNIDHNANLIGLPKYKCHKEVWAFKIDKIKYHNEDDPNAETDGSAGITGESCIVNVDRNYMVKHKPEIGGYYVLYKGGYKSFSPAIAFEEGYTLITK